MAISTLLVQAKRSLLTLDDEIDISRGDLLVPTGATIKATNQFLADVVWMTEQPFAAGTSIRH